MLTVLFTVTRIYRAALGSLQIKFPVIPQNDKLLSKIKKSEAIFSHFRHISQKVTNDVIVENSLDAAYKKAEQFDNQCFVIGGGSIYREAMKSADRIYLTHIHSEFDADTFFPKIDTNEWKMISSSDVKVDKESGIPYNFEIYIRK